MWKCHITHQSAVPSKYKLRQNYYFSIGTLIQKQIYLNQSSRPVKLILYNTLETVILCRNSNLPQTIYQGFRLASAICHLPIIILNGRKKYPKAAKRADKIKWSGQIGRWFFDVGAGVASFFCRWKRYITLMFCA